MSELTLETLSERVAELERLTAPLKVKGTNGRLPPIAISPDPSSNITMAERYKAVIGCLEGLPADAALNHDHYLYGTPKQFPEAEAK